MREALQFGVGYRSPYEDREQFDKLVCPMDTPEQEAVLGWMADGMADGMADMDIVSTPMGWQN